MHILKKDGLLLNEIFKYNRESGLINQNCFNPFQTK